ncbi:YjjG family noncanonical pyrimidine nucleotidase [Mangrovimonas cancribranchiae]|uniref:YjjG family noncanonical pyrimidine nucleotidase n=1 Tax=Mangrovimonas cancribranchiae TaxID=3080055 RepID=A0AAU6P8F2_9FLAO
MKLNGITDVFFDLDHTLWDFDKNSKLTFDKIFKINDIEVDLDEFVSVYEPINFQYWKLYREEKIDKKNLRFNRLQDTFTILKLQVHETTINKLSDDYITYLSTYNHLFNNAVEILHYLSKDYQLHIITNGFNQVQRKKLVNSKIDVFFKSVTDSESVGVKKPNSKIFNHAITLANTSPEQSIMIGDNLEADIYGALNVGIDAIFYNLNNTSVDNGIKQITSLQELKDYL